MRPKKHLGQHFLTAPTYAQKISDAVPANAGENVLEIGPGQGALSIFLKERFPEFHLVEVDQDAIDRLRCKMGEGKFTIHHADILKFEFEKAGFPLHVVGNLPYSIGALIIKKTLLYGNDIHSCTFMVQREVAERIVASSHSKQNGFLTVFCGFFGTPKILFHVPPGAFFPRPNVDSSVFQIILRQDLTSRLERSKWEEYFAFVSKGFSMRRKMLVNVLGGIESDRSRYVKCLDSMKMDPKVRPEDLDSDQWLELFLKSNG